MTTTPNRNYSLPSRHHDVVDDINDLRTTFGAVDEDLTDIESAVSELSDDVSDTQAVVIHTDSALEDTEIQNIAANRYLVVNRTGDGFECLDGGGDAGGKTGQCSIKKSDQEFDTAWGNISEVSKNGMIVKENAEASESGETHIFVDETEIDNDEQLPKVELTNCQAKSDFKSDSNSSVIIRDNIEEVKEEIQTATNLNYGFVKVGSGLSIDNGTLSAPVYSAATVDDFGLVKTGSGLNNNDGVISYDAISSATSSSFGVVKLGENLKINSNGEMEIDDMGISATIYDLGNVKVCSNGIVELEEATLRYRLFITEDLVIQFSMDFEPRDDFSFVLELVSDGTHLVAFSENLNPQMNTLPINRGITKIKFTKKLGVPSYDFEISRLDAPSPILLTPNYGDDINSNLLVTHNGSNWSAHDMMVSGTSNINFSGRELSYEFTPLVVVDYVYFTSAAPSEALGEFYLKASNDKQNWETLLYKNNEIVNGNIPTEIKGCYHYYKLYIGWKNSNYPRSIQLWGTQIDNNESELILLTPTMSSNETGFAKLTYSNLHENGASQLTDADANSYIYVKYSDDATDLFRWIKYEFPEAVVANMLDVAAYSNDMGRTMRWYTLEGSNDDQTWTLLLERQYQRDFYQLEARWHEFENTTAYKYYKLTCKSTNGDQYWKISRFRLFRRERGKHNFYRGVPKLSSANQDGYEVTVSSQYDNGHAGYLAFDDNTQTRWASAANEGTSWLKVKLPTATVFTAAKIAPRGDGYLDQAPSAFQIQGSNDGENWDVLDSETGVSWTTLGELRLFQFENETAYLYYRLYITANQGSGCNGCSCFILGNVIYEYKRYLETFEYLVPVMSSNSQDEYVVSASSKYNNNYAEWKAFNRTNSGEGDSWLTSTNQVSDSDGYVNAWLQIKLPEAKVVNYATFGCRGGNLVHTLTSARDWTLQGSDDGANWTILLTVTDQVPTTIGQVFSYSFENTTAYSYYRADITRISASQSIASIGQLNLVNKELITEY